jgi:phage baseplate assembly protein W
MATFVWKDLSPISGASYSSDIIALRNAVKMVLSVSPSEMLNNPEFGCDLTQVIYDPVDNFGANEIRHILSDCLTRFDPRISLNRATKIIPNIEEQLYDITLVLDVYGTSAYTDFSFLLYGLKE